MEIILTKKNSIDIVNRYRIRNERCVVQNLLGKLPFDGSHYDAACIGFICRTH